MARLSPGDQVTELRGITYDGKAVTLSEFRGKALWIIFYRYATCPLCNVHLFEVEKLLPALRKAGVEVIAVFESRPQQFQRLGGRRGSVPRVVEIFWRASRMSGAA